MVKQPQYLYHQKQFSIVSCADPKGGAGGLDPLLLEKSKINIGFLSNTGPDPLKITKLPSQHSMLGHHPHASETSAYSGIWILPPLINIKKLKKKTLSKITPFVKTFWISVWVCFNVENTVLKGRSGVYKEK